MATFPKSRKMFNSTLSNSVSISSRHRSDNKVIWSTGWLWITLCTQCTVFFLPSWNFNYRWIIQVPLLLLFLPILWRFHLDWWMLGLRDVTCQSSIQQCTTSIIKNEFHNSIFVSINKTKKMCFFMQVLIFNVNLNVQFWFQSLLGFVDIQCFYFKREELNGVTLSALMCLNSQKKMKH